MPATEQETGGIPAGRGRGEALCAPCVYAMANIAWEEIASPLESAHRLCGLGFGPDDELCREMRTENCRIRRRTGHP